ncbi:hypothetical protein [Neobacillus sp. Marseille-QA0830]
MKILLLIILIVFLIMLLLFRYNNLFNLVVKAATAIKYNKKGITVALGITASFVFWGVVITYGVRAFIHTVEESQKEKHPPCYYTYNCSEPAPRDDGYYDASVPSGDNNNYGDSPGYHHVDGYYRSDGTHVNGYIRSNPDGNPNNNLGGK